MCLQSCAARTTSANAKWDKADITLYDPSVPGTAPSKALKTLVRQGIPDDLRPHLWLLFSGGLAKKRASPPGHFAMLQRKALLGASGPPLSSPMRSGGISPISYLLSCAVLKPGQSHRSAVFCHIQGEPLYSLRPCSIGKRAFWHHLHVLKSEGGMDFQELWMLLSWALSCLALSARTPSCPLSKAPRQSCASSR